MEKTAEQLLSIRTDVVTVTEHIRDLQEELAATRKLLTETQRKLEVSRRGNVDLREELACLREKLALRAA